LLVVISWLIVTTASTIHSTGASPTTTTSVVSIVSDFTFIFVVFIFVFRDVICFISIYIYTFFIIRLSFLYLSYLLYNPHFLLTNSANYFLSLFNFLFLAFFIRLSVSSLLSQELFFVTYSFLVSFLDKSLLQFLQVLKSVV
jgi:hypothetical protein